MKRKKMTEEIKPKLTLKLSSDKLKTIQSRLKTVIPKAPKIKVQKMPREEYKEVLDTVRRRFSKAFSKSADPIKILKNGIHKDLSQKLGMEEYKVWRFLYVYTKKMKYQLALKLDAPRHDLKGKITSNVLKEEMSKPPKKKKGKKSAVVNF